MVNLLFLFYLHPPSSSEECDTESDSENSEDDVSKLSSELAKLKQDLLKANKNLANRKRDLTIANANYLRVAHSREQQKLKATVEA